MIGKGRRERNEEVKIRREDLKKGIRSLKYEKVEL